MSVMRITHVRASSPDGWYEAVQAAFKRATKTIRNIKGFEVTRFGAKVENNEIVEYEVEMEIYFELEG